MDIDLHTNMENHSYISGFSGLPQEIVDCIVAHLFPSEKNYGILLHVNWAIHRAALPHIYKAPQITSKNLSAFGETMTSRQCVHYCALVRVLNLQKVIHGAKVSQMSRILRKCSRSLLEFYAPQVGFTQSAFRAIGLLPHIRVLDLSSVSEKVEVTFFLAALAKAETLEMVNFPRFSKNTLGPLKTRWPTHLKHIGLSGAVDDELLDMKFPSGVDSVVFQHCLSITLPGVLTFLERIGPQLRSFAALYPLALPSDAFNNLLSLCPALIYFKGYVDYFTRAFFLSIPDSHPLETLVLDSAGGLLDRENKINPDDVSLAIVEGKLNRLRKVRWSLQVGWRTEKSDVRDLGDLLADAEI